MLRSVSSVSVFAGVITESLAYSTLQSGPEFARWLDERGPAQLPELPDPVQAERRGGTLSIRFNRTRRHNAFTTDARAAPAGGSRGGPPRRLGDRGWCWPATVLSFCSGGDLAEFGTFADPASAHLARTRHSPALVLGRELAGRLGPGCRAEVHGQVLGSGLEMAAYCGHIRCHPDATIGLPELALGLIPGAGGTVSITRRIGRWRTAYLVLSVRPSTRRRRWPGGWSTRSAADVPAGSPLR